MAKPYLEILSQMIEGLEPRKIRGVTIEYKHFFSGAALYANGKICASLSPAGFALKLSEDLRQGLISAGQGEEFRFFPNGPIKRDYVTLSESVIQDKKALHELINESVRYVVHLPNYDRDR